VKKVYTTTVLVYRDAMVQWKSGIRCGPGVGIKNHDLVTQKDRIFQKYHHQNGTYLAKRIWGLDLIKK